MENYNYNIVIIECVINLLVRYIPLQTHLYDAQYLWHGGTVGRSGRQQHEQAVRRRVRQELDVVGAVLEVECYV